MAKNIENIVVPSLDPDGWVYSSKKQADYVMAYFLATDRSQSYIFDSDVTSFQYILATHHGNISELVHELQIGLRKLFERYFNNVQVEVRDITKEESPSKVYLALSCRYTLADGTIEDLIRIVNINGSKFTIMRQAISGEAYQL